jgi:hypothetical protein
VWTLVVPLNRQQQPSNPNASTPAKMNSSPLSAQSVASVYSSASRQYNYHSAAFRTHTSGSGTGSSVGASAASPSRQGQPQDRLSTFAQTSVLIPQSSMSRLSSPDSQEKNTVAGYSSPTGPSSAPQAGDNPNNSGKYGAVHQLTRAIGKHAATSDKSKKTSNT